MTDKQNNPDPIAHAARLLREAAEELRQAHAYNNSEGWENETDAKAAYDEHMAAAQALEDWEAAVGAGGVQPLRSAQERCKLVPLEPTQEMLAALMSPGEAEVLASSPSETFALMLMDRAGIRERYSAMLGAAPDASTADVEDAIAWLVTWKGGEHTYVHAHASELPAVTQARVMGGTVTPCVAALAASPTPPAEQQAPSAAAADTVVLEAVLRAIHQAIDLIGEPDTERLRTVRRVLRGAVIVAEDAGEAATAPQPAPAPLSEREEIAMIDAAMVEMANIVPPLKRSECARLLREAAEELRQAHTYPRSEDWGRETDAKAAYDEHMAAAQALEDWEAAVGAGGVSGQLMGRAPEGMVGGWIASQDQMPPPTTAAGSGKGE